MKEFRKGKNCTEHYTSFDELREGFKLPPIKKRTSDAEKLKVQQEKFLGTCKVCKSQLSLIKGTNVLACQNPNCSGVKMTSTDEEGNEKVWYIPVSRMLNSKGLEIGLNLFD